MTRVHNGRARRAVQLAIPPVVEGVIWGTADTHRPLETWWPGAIPAASLVKIEGRKSTGKSTVAAAIAASISGGPVVPGWTGPTDRRVLWQSGEEDWDRIVGPRLRRAGVPVGMYGRLTARTTRGDPRRVVLPDDLPILSDAIREGGVGLVVLDPYSSLVGSSIDLSVPQQARLWLELIAETFAAAQAVCLCVGHVRKGRGGDSREAGYGCAETANVMRSIMRC
ncbi:MAG: AAA family ATPase, partial [Pseudonocardiaceae bacterium]